MSEELFDEIEAINSIFGESTLIPHVNPWSSTSPAPSSIPPPPSAKEYILQLPQHASSLHVQFLPEYPLCAPLVLGTHSSSGGVKGAGARDLGLFQTALKTVFQEGAVCLFDALGEWEKLYAEIEVIKKNGLGEEHGLQQEDEDDEDDEDEEGTRKVPRKQHVREEVGAEHLKEPPPWAVSDVFVENKSTFLAHVAPVTSLEQAQSYLAHLLASDKRIASATHNISAWRIRGGGGLDGGKSTFFQDCDDDGETAAGGRLLHLMQLMDVWDVMVVVTRWYGGVKLGGKRFALINAVARDGLVKAGMVKEGKEGKKGGAKS